MRSVTHIVAILKLPQILLKMLPADMNVRSVNPALQLRPEAFDGIDASALLSRVLPLAVVYADMAITRLVDILVAAKFICVERRAGNDMLQNDGLHSTLSARLDNPRNQLAIAFQHTDNASLVALIAAAHARHGAAYQRFVNFNRFTDAAKRIVAIERAHILADFVAHTPSRLVGYAKLALDFLGSNARPRSGEQEDDIKPVLQWGAGALKGRSGHRGNLVAAELA